MENKALFLGIFCCLQIGAWSKDAYVVVKENKEVKVGDPLSLECYGSDSTLSYYIKNRLVLSLKDSYSGQYTKISSSFYPSEEKKPLKESGDLTIEYKTVPVQNAPSLYVFNITLKAAQHSDDGVYTCTLMDEYDQKVDAKSFRVTVLNPVERMLLEVKEVQGARSTHAIVSGDRSYTVRPGKDYTVHCKASGSNPAPVMGLMYNEAKPSVMPVFMNSTSEGQLKYFGSYEKVMQFNPSLGTDQTLVCSANVPNKQFPTREAGLKLIVSIDKPEIVCGNVSSMMNDRSVKLVCNISTPAGLEHLSCNKVFWELPEIQLKIPTNGDKSVTRKKTENMDILEGSCDPKPKHNLLETTLMIYHVKRLHFETNYYIQYEDAGNVYRVPVVLYEKVSSAHLIFPSLLMCILVAVISKLTANSL